MGMSGDETLRNRKIATAGATLTRGVAAGLIPHRQERTQPVPGGCEQSAEQSGVVQKRVTAQGGWGRRPAGDAPRSDASALGARWLLPARPQPPSRGGSLRRCRRCRQRFGTLIQLSSNGDSIMALRPPKSWNNFGP